MSGSSAAQLFGVAFTLGGILVSTFAASVVPEKYHAYAFYLGLGLIGIGCLLFLLNLPVAQELAAKGWPKRLSLGLGLLLFISLGWWQFNPMFMPPSPNISFQKFALFWVGLDKGNYQLGTVIKFFNLSFDL